MTHFSSRWWGLPATLIILVGMVAAGPASAASGTWKVTGRMSVGRAYHTATLLQSGQVLVAGGCPQATTIACGSAAVLASAEVFNPTTSTWSLTGSMNSARERHTATLLPSGQVLVAGGKDNHSNTLASAELYNPATGTWTLTGSMAYARIRHTATLLPSGQVLIAGGGDASGNALSSAELYDPATGTWSITGSMNVARIRATATLLNNGLVLVAGGELGHLTFSPLSSAELYDPATGTWSLTGSMNTSRRRHEAALLQNGQVLVTGGQDALNNTLSSTELYDPATGTWSLTGSMATARLRHQETVLTTGKVLVSGGQDSSDNAIASAELYDPAAGTWSATGNLNTLRVFHQAVRLLNGRVLVASGIYTSTVRTAEVYFP